MRAAKGQRRRPQLGPKALSIASSLLFIAVVIIIGAVFAPGCAAEAKSTSPAVTRSRVAYKEPTPAEGGKVVHYNLTLGVAKRAPDCFREFFFGGGGVVLFLCFFYPCCPPRRRCFLFFFFAQPFFIEKPDKPREKNQKSETCTLLTVSSSEKRSRSTGETFCTSRWSTRSPRTTRR